MFNDGMSGISTLSLAIFESVKDVIVQNNIETILEDNVQFINDKGDIYIPYSKQYFCRDSGEYRFPFFAPKDSNRTMGPMQYFQDFKEAWLDPNITTITYNRTISVVSLLKQLADEEMVYGVVLQGINGNEKFAINPLHPIVAFLITAGLLELPDEGKIHVFEWKENKFDKVKEKSDINSEIKSYIKDFKKIFEIAPDIIKEPIKLIQEASISDSDITSIIEDPFVESLNANIFINKKDSGNADINKIKSILIPHQLIVDGTLSPFYGLSIIKDPSNSNIQGAALGPMATGNISLDHYDGERGFKNWSTSGNNTNVCTGSESATSPRGWFTLSRVNLNSMYYSDVISKEYVFPFLKASKQVSSDIWGVQLEEELKMAEEMEVIV